MDFPLLRKNFGWTSIEVCFITGRTQAPRRIRHNAHSGPTIALSMNKSSSHCLPAKCYQKNSVLVSTSSRCAENPEPVLSSSRLSLDRRLFVVQLSQDTRNIFPGAIRAKDVLRMITAHLNRIATAVPEHDVHEAFVGFADLILADPRLRAVFRRMASRANIAHRYSFLDPFKRSGQFSL